MKDSHYGRNKKTNGIELFFLNSLNKEVKKATPFKISHSHPEAYANEFAQKEFENTRKRVKKLSTVD